MSTPETETLDGISTIELFLATSPDQETDRALSEIFNENHPSEE